MLAVLQAHVFGLLKWVKLAIAVLLLFAAFLLMQGVNPLATFAAMFKNVAGNTYSIGEVIIKASPFLLTGLATAIPARAGLVNVGGEGQLLIGALAATFVAVFLGNSMPMIVTLPILAMAGVLGGVAWAGIAGILRIKFRLNETICTLLLNYIAFFLIGFFIHGPLKDPASFNWPFSPPFADVARLPIIISGTRVHLGVGIAILAAILVWFIINRTSWGFRLGVVGGNPEAARRAGIGVGKILLISMLVGGSLAGLAGMLEVSGVEGRLNPTTGVGLGYVGFLAAWTVSHKPLWLIASSLLLAMIVVSGDALQIYAGLPSSSVNILTALIFIGVLATKRRPKE